MLSLRKMKKMNYSEAWNYFMKPEMMGSQEAIDYVNYVSKKTLVYDLRDQPVAFVALEKIYKGGWLIIIDGVSCSGKSTMAKKIAEKFPETVEVIDIDYTFKAWVYQKLNNISPEKRKKVYYSMLEKQGDEYLRLNLENMVDNRAGEGKTVILVGCFLQTIYRAFLGKTLGKYFDNVAIFTVYEDEKTLKKYQQSREADFGNDGGDISLEQINETAQQYQLLKEIIANQPKVLGFGADLAILVNHKTKLY